MAAIRTNIDEVLKKREATRNDINIEYRKVAALEGIFDELTKLNLVAGSILVSKPR